MTSDPSFFVGGVLARTAIRMRALVLFVAFVGQTLLLVTLTGCSDGTNNSDSTEAFREEHHAAAGQRVEAYIKAREVYHEKLPDSAYNQLVKEIATQNEYAVEFCELYSQAFQQSSRMFDHVGPTLGLASNGLPWDELVFSVPLYGRYEFRCIIPFYLSADYATVEAFRDPYYVLYATTHYDQKPDGGLTTGGRYIYFSGDVSRYQLEDWIWFKKHDRDWAKVGVSLIMDAPWPEFDEYCRRNRID